MCHICTRLSSHSTHLVSTPSKSHLKVRILHESNYHAYMQVYIIYGSFVVLVEFKGSAWTLWLLTFYRWEELHTFTNISPSKYRHWCIMVYDRSGNRGCLIDVVIYQLDFIPLIFILLNESIYFDVSQNLCHSCYVSDKCWKNAWYGWHTTLPAHPLLEKIHLGFTFYQWYTF